MSMRNPPCLAWSMAAAQRDKWMDPSRPTSRYHLEVILLGGLSSIKNLSGSKGL